MKPKVLFGFLAGLAAGNLLAKITADQDGDGGPKFLGRMKRECDSMLEEMEEKLESVKRKAAEKFDDQAIDLRFTV